MTPTNLGKRMTRGPLSYLPKDVQETLACMSHLGKADLRGLPLYLDEDGMPTSSPEAVGTYIGELLLHGGATWVDIPAMIAATTGAIAHRVHARERQQLVEVVARIILAENLCRAHGEDLIGVLLYTGTQHAFPRSPEADPNLLVTGENVGFRAFAEAVEKAYETLTTQKRTS